MLDERLEDGERSEDVQEDGGHEESFAAHDDDSLQQDEGFDEAEIHAETQGLDETGTEEHAADDGVHGTDHETEAVEHAPGPEVPAGPVKNWYIIHAYSGFEQKVA